LLEVVAIFPQPFIGTMEEVVEHQFEIEITKYVSRPLRHMTSLI